jgi:hypothetical protein
MVFASLVLYYLFAYELIRSEFLKLITLYGALFFLCFKLIQFEKWNYKFLLVIGLLFRVVFLIAEPNLSQDYYRFIWDGSLLLDGINPYLYLPDVLVNNAELAISNAETLHQGMGDLSAKNYSNYPPFNQLLFAFSVLLGGKSILGSVIAMRSMTILADLGIFYFGRKLLKHVNRSPHLIFWYFLNPLVIIELTGNLHFEGIMLFFFIWSVYLITVNKWLLAAVIYALSISVKLIPLLFLPLFLRYFGFKKSILFYIVTLLAVTLTLAPFYNEVFIENYSQTIALWFSNFEFNASVYNLVKDFAGGFEIKPWELIKIYGKIVPVIVLLVLSYLSFFKKNQKVSEVLLGMLIVLSLYYFLSATVHPWYVVFLVLLTIFTEFRYSLFWSAMIILSYSAYSNPEAKEHIGLLVLEYFVVYGFMVYEIIRMKGSKLIIRKK